MKIIFSLLFVMVAAFAITTVKAQAKIGDDIVISEQCLGQVKTLEKAVDWQPAIKDEVLRFPYRKTAFVEDQNWMFASIILGGDFPIFIGRSTSGGDMFTTKVFGIVTKVEQVNKPSPQPHVNISYRPINCTDDQVKVVNKLANDGRYGKRARQYIW